MAICSSQIHCRSEKCPLFSFSRARLNGENGRFAAVVGRTVNGGFREFEIRLRMAEMGSRAANRQEPNTRLVCFDAIGACTPVDVLPGSMTGLTTLTLDNVHAEPNAPVQSALLLPWLARDPVLVAIMLRIIARLITPSRCEPNSARRVTVWRSSKMAQRGHWRE